MLVFKVLYETWLISRWKCVDLLTPFLSGQWCLSVLNNCYHVAVMCCSLNFICSMTIFRISFIFDSPHPLNLPRGSDPGIQSNIQSDIFHIYCCFLSVCIQSFGNNISPVENQNDLELDFKVFFFADSCCSDIVLDESNWCHSGIIERFEILKMASKMAVN